jgi:hypothetical protein
MPSAWQRACWLRGGGMRVGGMRVGGGSPRNPRFPIYRLCLQTTFPARVSIFKSGISGSDCSRALNKLGTA